MDPFSATTATAAPASPSLVDIPGMIRLELHGEINESPETREWLIRQGAIEIRYGKHDIGGYFIMVVDTRLRLTREELELNDPAVVPIMPIAQKYYFAAYTGFCKGPGTSVDVGTMLRLWTLYDIPGAHLTVLDILHRRQAREFNDAIVAASNAQMTGLNAGEDTMGGVPLTESALESIETDHIKYEPQETREGDELMSSNEPLPAAGSNVFLTEEEDLGSFLPIYDNRHFEEAMENTDLHNGGDTADGDLSTRLSGEIIETDPFIQWEPDEELLTIPTVQRIGTDIIIKWEPEGEPMTEWMMEMIDIDHIVKSEPDAESLTEPTMESIETDLINWEPDEEPLTEPVAEGIETDSVIESEPGGVSLTELDMQSIGTDIIIKWDPDQDSP